MDYFFDHTDSEALARRLAERVGGLLAAATADHGRASLAVPGGRTPGPFLTRLGNLDLDWARIGVTVTDERCVPSDHERSNAKLVADTLLASGAWDAAFVPLTGDGAAAALAGLMPIDVGVFGMGEDYHTASLFPGADGTTAALAPDAPLPLATIRAAHLPDERLSLTAPAIASIRHRFLLIQGEEKLRAYRSARDIGDPARAPVNVLFEGDGADVYYAP